MKRKTQSTSQYFKMPHLFREDLEHIEAVLKEIPASEYQLETPTFEYKEVNELPKDLDLVNEFHIQSYSPYISIDFNQISARIYAGDDEIKTSGAVKKITEIISKRERKILYWSSKLSSWLAPILFFSPLQVFLEISKEGKKLSFNSILGLLLVILLPIIAAVWWIIGYKSSFKKFSIIEFGYKKDRLSFFLRNRDQIILITIGALLGALATIFFQKILDILCN